MDEFDKAMAGLRVNVIVRGMPLGAAKAMIENHFGPELNWPAASGGSTRVEVAPNITVEIKVEDY